MSQFTFSETTIEARDIYLFHRNSEGAGKLIFIIDDELPSFDYEKETFDSSIVEGTAAVIPILEVTKTWPETKAIAFITAFPLRDDMYKKIKDVLQWIISIVGENEEDQKYYLLDQFYGTDIGSGNAELMAWNYLMFIKQLESPINEVRFGILSRAPQRLIDEEVKFLPSKQDIQIFYQQESNLPQPLLDFFGKSNAPVKTLPHQWEKETWNRVRTALAQEFGEKDVPHHMYFGDMDDLANEDIFVSKISECIKNAGNIHESIVGRIKEDEEYEKGLLPKDGWVLSSYDDDEENDPNTYQKPPLRALAQRSSTGHDLTTAIYLAARNLEERSEGNKLFGFQYFISSQLTDSAIKLKIGRARRLRHDYLWFNAPALLDGMLELAHEFGTIIGQIRSDGHQHLNREVRDALEGAVLEPLTVLNGNLEWHFIEFEEGMKITIKQSINYWHSYSETIIQKNLSKPEDLFPTKEMLYKQPTLVVRPLPFTSNPAGKLARAIKQMERGGARVVDYGDDLKLVVDAGTETMERGPYWTLKY